MYDVSINPHAERAHRILRDRFEIGYHRQVALLESVEALHIKDRLIDPRVMRFTVAGRTPQLALHTYPTGKPAEVETIQIHRHAFSQMCLTSGFTQRYAKFLLDQEEAWSKDLFTKNFEELFHQRQYLDRHGNPTRFLCRTVNGAGRHPELRGFVSRNFNRQLASMPLLRGFVGVCCEMKAEPLEASTSDVFFSLKCFLPHVFEPVPGEFVAFGVSWSNSDFGAGKLSVSLCALRISGGGPIVLDDAMSRRHIGSVIQDSDLELSEDTASKELTAQIAATRDIVTQLLSPEAIDRMVLALGKAAEEDIPWARIKTELKSILGTKELTSLKDLIDSGITELPPPRCLTDGEKVPTRWWVSNAVAQMAQKEVDPERKAELQAAAGSVLKVKTK